CCRSTNLQSRWMQPHAQHGPAHPGQNVNGKSNGASEQPLRELAKAPKNPHVHGEMQRIRMNKAGRYQAPVFSAERIRSEVTAPTQQSLITEAHERCQRSTAENHPQEHRSIDAYEKRGGGKLEHHARIQPAAGAASCAASRRG